MYGQNGIDWSLADAAMRTPVDSFPVRSAADVLLQLWASYLSLYLSDLLPSICCCCGPGTCSVKCQHCNRHTAAAAAHVDPPSALWLFYLLAGDI